MAYFLATESKPQIPRNSERLYAYDTTRIVDVESAPSRLTKGVPRESPLQKIPVHRTYDTRCNLVPVDYYLYRFYGPEIGRFLNRDPIEEEGGLNIYAVAKNDVINMHDVFGLRACCNDKCSSGENRNCKVTDVDIDPAGDVGDGNERILKKTLKILSKGGKVAPMLFGMIDYYAKLLQYNVIITVEYEECKTGRCLIFFKRLEWKDADPKRYNCVANPHQPSAVGNDGFDVSDTGLRGLSQIRTDCMKQAKDSICGKK